MLCRADFWHQTHIVFSFVVTTFVGTVIFEYSYSAMFQENFFESIMILEVRDALAFAHGCTDVSSVVAT
jgi:hypothetical protein